MFTLGGLNLPEPEKLPGTNLKSPFYFIGDGAFPLNTSIMKPYGNADLDQEHRAFNYRFKSKNLLKKL